MADSRTAAQVIQHALNTFTARWAGAPAMDRQKFVAPDEGSVMRAVDRIVFQVDGATFVMDIRTPSDPDWRAMEQDVKEVLRKAVLIGCSDNPQADPRRMNCQQREQKQPDFTVKADGCLSCRATLTLRNLGVTI